MPRMTRRREILANLDAMILAQCLYAQPLRSTKPDRTRLTQLASFRALVCSLRYTKSRHYVERPLVSLFVEIDGMPSDQFKAEFRLCKESFWLLHDRIKGHAVFATRPRGRNQHPVAAQLLVFLQYVGFSGNGASFRRTSRLGHCSVGSVETFVGRSVAALLCLRPLAITWPGTEEQRSIAQYFEDEYGFPGCVGVADGSLMPLASKPEQFGEDYFSRKCSYSINTLLVCDHERRFRYVYTGWPGSSHDQRVFANSKLGQHLGSWIRQGNYIMADSAYTPHEHVVPPFKKPHGQQLPPRKEAFNRRLSNLRVCIEHSIGILKGRFQMLKSIRVVISDLASMKKIVSLIETCIIIHNLCLSDTVPDEWLESNEQEEEQETQQRRLSGSTGDRGIEHRDLLVDYLESNGWI